VALAAAGQASEAFQVVGVGYVVGGCGFLPIHSGPYGFAFDPSRFEFVPTFHALAGYRGQAFAVTQDSRRVVRVHSTGLGETFAQLPASLGFVRALAIAPNGRLFANTSAGLAVISASGVIEATHAFPHIQYDDVMAVGMDGCTVYTISRDHGTVHRVNGCTAEVLPNFSAAGDLVLDVEALSSGDMLVVTYDGRVVQYQPSGTLVRVVADLASYEPNSGIITAIAISPDETSIWLAAMSICDSGRSDFLHLSMGDGRLLSRREEFFLTDVTEMAAVSPDRSIPTASSSALLLLALTLALAGLSVLRR
jgi:hypothetical protein